MEFGHRYGPRRRVVVSFPAGEGRTKQSFKDECDINRIMARYAVTGILPQTREALGRFEDVSEIDFQNAMYMIGDAKAAFHSLPSFVRARFDNDPAALLRFLGDTSNRAEAVALGLVVESAGEVPGPEGAAGAEAVQSGKSNT